jgi:hypothetical protein
LFSKGNPKDTKRTGPAAEGTKDAKRMASTQQKEHVQSPLRESKEDNEPVPRDATAPSTETWATDASRALQADLAALGLAPLKISLRIGARTWDGRVALRNKLLALGSPQGKVADAVARESPQGAALQCYVQSPVHLPVPTVYSLATLDMWNDWPHWKERFASLWRLRFNRVLPMVLERWVCHGTLRLMCGLARCHSLAPYYETSRASLPDSDDERSRNQLMFHHGVEKIQCEMQKMDVYAWKGVLQQALANPATVHNTLWEAIDMDMRTAPQRVVAMALSCNGRLLEKEPPASTTGLMVHLGSMGHALDGPRRDASDSALGTTAPPTSSLDTALTPMPTPSFSPTLFTTFSTATPWSWDVLTLLHTLPKETRVVAIQPWLAAALRTESMMSIDWQPGLLPILLQDLFHQHNPGFLPTLPWYRLVHYILGIGCDNSILPTHAVALAHALGYCLLTMVDV